MKPMLCVVTLLLSASISHARPAKSEVVKAPKQEQQPIPIKKGVKTPFAGWLFTTESAVTISQNANQCPKIVATEVEKATDLVKVDLDLAKRNLAILEGTTAARDELMGRRIDGAEKWYRAPVFVAAAASLLTVATILVARETIIGVKTVNP